MCEQVRFGHRLMVVGAGNKAHYVTVSISLFEIIHNFKKIEKKVWLERGEEAGEALNGQGAYLMGPARPRDQMSLSLHVLLTSPVSP